MFYEVYVSKEQQVEAAIFETENDIGEVVQNLYDSGATYVNVTKVPLNPHLEDTSYITTVSFMQNGVLQTMVIGDVLSFDEEDNAVVWNEADFFEKYEYPETEGGDE